MAASRSIFEEVNTDEKPVKGSSQKEKRDGRGAIRLWLALLFALVVAMIAIGGLTRLTDSGLSITEWRPVTGALPPLTAEAWDSEFAKYKEIPEFQLQNKEMNLSEFKTIYWWEWGHRQFGRVIGLVWAVGFLLFAIRRQIPRGWTPRFVALGALGGLQGAIGWWMVSSGLGGEAVDVAPYRLATHLGLAFIILGLIAWYYRRLGHSEAELLQARRRRIGAGMLALVLVVMVFAQTLLGGLVAGLDAGRTYTDWPLMGGAFFPGTGLELEPLWRNFFENEGLTQFNHRIGGYLILIVAGFAWWRSRSAPISGLRRAFDWVLVLTIGQALIGIITVRHAAPWPLGLGHQLLGVALFVAVVMARFASLYPPEEKIARN